jgi:hypothetical protein
MYILLSFIITNNNNKERHSADNVAVIVEYKTQYKQLI